jgi:hypothetical protein
MSESKYQPEEGTADYVHVRVTHKQGRELPKPQVETYHPSQYTDVSKLAGFKGDILHDPRTAKQKKQEAPAVGTVKTDGKLESPDQYRARYKELFKEEPAFNMVFADLKTIVDRAEARLAEGPDGVKPVDEDAKAAAEKEAADKKAAAEKKAADKAAADAKAAAEKEAGK